MLSKAQKLAGLKKLVIEYRKDTDAANKNKKRKVPAVRLLFGDDLKNLEFIPTGILEFEARVDRYRWYP